ncbi:MAG: hypothetical protein KBE16_03000 [Alphaproteobacteria bacterium]|nr:hypothetical protein [Alphaproteobacteria bacterium]MBP9877474.1 hypothetical protein [Alphaproteobacteria bacterium]
MSHLRPYNDMLQVSYFTDAEAASIHCGEFKLFTVRPEEQVFWTHLKTNHASQVRSFLNNRSLTARDVLNLAQTCKSLYNLIQPQQSFIRILDCFHGKALLQIIKENSSLQFPLIFFQMKPTGHEHFNAPHLDSLSAAILEKTNPYLKDMRSVCIDRNRSLWDENIFSSFDRLYRTVSEIYLEKLDLLTQENCDLIMRYVPQLTSVYVYYGVDIRHRNQYQSALQSLLATELSEKARHLPFTFQFSDEELAPEEAISLFNKFPKLKAIDSAINLKDQAQFIQYEQNLGELSFVRDISVDNAAPDMGWLSLIERSDLTTVRFQETLSGEEAQAMKLMLERLDPSVPLKISSTVIRTKVSFQIQTESEKKCQIHYTMLGKLDRKFAELRRQFMALKEAQTEEEKVPQQAQDNQTLENSGLLSQLFHAVKNISRTAPKKVKKPLVTNPIPDLITSHTATSLKIEGKSDNKRHPISPLDETLIALSQQFPALSSLTVKGFIGSTPTDRDSVPFFNNLTRLKLHSVHQFRTETLDYYFHSMPYLDSLSIKNSKTHILAEIKRSLPNLKRVNLCLFEMTSRSLALFLKQTPNLQTLVLHTGKKTTLTDLDFKRKGATLDRLESLQIHSLEFINSEHVLKAIADLPSLRKLVISHCKMIKKEDFQAIREKALVINPQLRMMNA